MKRFCILSAFSLLLLSSCGTDNYRLYVFFDNVEGLSTDSDVTSRGLSIGTIENLKLHENGVLAELEFDDGIVIPEGSAFNIIQPGLIAPPIIDVELGEAQKSYRSGDTLTGRFGDNPLSDEKRIPDSLAIEKLHQLIDTLAKQKK